MLHLKYYDVGYVAVEGVSARKSVFLEFILLYQKLKKRFWTVCLVETYMYIVKNQVACYRSNTPIFLN